ARLVVWIISSVVAAHIRHRTAIHGDGYGGHHSVGGRGRLQLAVGGKDEGGDSRRYQHRDHPRHGWQRIRRDRGRNGVRVHDDLDVGQCHARRRPSRHHDRYGSVVRHVGHSGVHDAVDCRASWQVVLVAAGGGPAARGDGAEVGETGNVV